MILINFTSENNENSSENFFMTGCVKTLANGHKASVNDVIQISNKNIASVSQEKIIIWNLEKFSFHLGKHNCKRFY